MRTSRVSMSAALGSGALGFVVLGAGAAHGAVLVGNFGAAGNNVGTVFGAGTTSVYKATGFTMGSDAYQFDGVTLSMDFTYGAGNGVPQVTLWSGAGAPATQLAVLSNPALGGAGDFTFTPPQAITLQPSTTYWIYLVETSGTGAFRWNGTTPGTNPSGAVAFAGYIWNGSSSSTQNRIQVDGTLGMACASPQADYGTGCPGAGGFVPMLSLDNCAAGGAPVSISISKGQGGSTAYLFFGLGQAAAPIGLSGCTLNVAPVFPQPIPVPLSGTAAGAGNATLAGVVPASASGFTVTMQVFVSDLSQPHGFSNSNGTVMMVQ